VSRRHPPAKRARRPLRRLDVVIVSWNNGASVGRCLDSLAAAATPGFAYDRIVIVDNASDIPFEADEYPGLPPLTMICNTRNVGFAEGCVQGAAESRADYLLFLNPDTSVSRDALAAAVTAMETKAYERTAILGVPLVDEEGVTQATCGRFLTVTRIFNQLSGLSMFFPRWCPGFRMTDWDHTETRQVDYVSGACMLIRREVWDTLGGFDSRFVVYLEDADLALRAQRLGWDSVFLVGPPVYHEGGWGTGRSRGVRLFHAWRSLLAYGWKHFNVAAACAVAAMVFALAPGARIAQALVHRSGRQVAEAIVGYGRLWRTVPREIFTAIMARLRGRYGSVSRGAAAASLNR
jgi:N-acetylglucosaminyl-diphospho-decaprenol L-rhamnosyltransferase